MAKPLGEPRPEIIGFGIIPPQPPDVRGPNICFAWEGLTLRLARIANSPPSFSYLQGLAEVSIIVVIGYSFPYFNREIDQLIFGRFSNKLRRVYIQYPEGVHVSIEERLKTLLPLGSEDLIVRISGTDLFYIPDEF